MFNFSAQAAAIVAKLETIANFGTVAYIDKDDQSMRFPATLPAAFLALDEMNPGVGGSSTTLPMITWAVVIRSKSMEGPTGCLSLIDEVISALVGFRVGTGVKPLHLGKIEYFNKQAESVAYVVRFDTQAAAANVNTPCRQ